MIKQGDKIVNPRTGQIMIFKTTGKESNGALLEIESFNPVSNEREPIHIHPKQESSIEVLSGILHVWVNGKEHILTPNQRIVVPAGIPHCFWNEGPEEVYHVGTFSPALNIAEFFDSFFALARDGQLNKLWCKSWCKLKRVSTYKTLKPLSVLVGPPGLEPGTT